MRNGVTGARIFRVPLAERAEARWGAPYLHVHRADLLAALSSAAQTAGVTIRAGARVTSHVVRPEGPVLRLSDGEVLEGDLVIGADGIRSVLRSEINGPEEPKFAGQIAWRGVIETDRLPPRLVAPEATVWAGPDRHLVTYCLRGGALVNFVAVEERVEWTAEGWSAPGNADELRRSFDGWHPDVTRLLEQVSMTFLWGLFGRPAQVCWARGPLALVGDAAHPMLPFLAQGAAMALEDVAVLMRALQAFDRIPDALLAYESRRWDRVTRVQDRSRDNGRFFHRYPIGGLKGHWGLVSLVSRCAPGLAARQLDWLYGYDATAGSK
jgi:salicylate hydroxylase